MNRIWIAIVLSVSAAGCRQDIGERCQFNEDCASGQCSTAQPQVCVSTNRQLDPIDASDPCPGCHDPNADAGANAMMDAGTDAMMDAAADAP